VLGEELGLGHERGQRGPKLVRDVGREPPLPLLRGGQRCDLPLERVRHLVERDRPRPELVGALDRDAGLEQPLRERAGRSARPRDGRERAASEDRADQCRQERKDDDAREEDVPQVGELAAQLGLGEEEVELDGGARHAAAGDERGLAAHLRALVAELAAANEGLEPRRDLGLPDRDARREARLARAADRGEVAARGEGGEELVGRLAIRALAQHLCRELEVEARLVGRPLDRVVEARLADDPVRAGCERERRDARDERERDREAAAQPPGRNVGAHQPSPRR
jgi:hypothetical protein